MNGEIYFRILLHSKHSSSHCLCITNIILVLLSYHFFSTKLSHRHFSLKYLMRKTIDKFSQNFFSSEKDRQLWEIETERLKEISAGNISLVLHECKKIMEMVIYLWKTKIMFICSQFATFLPSHITFEWKPKPSVSLKCNSMFFHSKKIHY